MKIALFTDIHENFQSVEKAIKLLKKVGYDILVCLGDITGYSADYYSHIPDANACIELLREEAEYVLVGNHDLFTSRRLPSYHFEKGMPLNWYDLTFEEQKAITNNSLWLYEREVIPVLSYENIKFLDELPEFCTIETEEGPILFSHFIKPDLTGAGTWMPHRISQLDLHFSFMEENKCRLAFTGHFHPDEITLADKFFRTHDGMKPIKIKRKPVIVLCPALSGKKNMGSCIIFNSDTDEIIPYILE